MGILCQGITPTTTQKHLHSPHHVRRGRCCSCGGQWLRHVQGRVRRRRRPQGCVPLHCGAPQAPCTLPSRPCSPSTPLAVPLASSWTPVTVCPTVSPSMKVMPSPTPL